MTLSIPTTESDPISLEEYMEYVSRLDLQDEASVVESANHLRALAANKRLLIDHINAELGTWASFQPNNAYSAQTMTLGSGKDFSVRANIWMPPSVNDDGWEDHLYAYGLPHDHNFSFLTVGYTGPGYATSIYQYDNSGIVGYPGEDVELHFLEHTHLPAGKVMLYRASRDIHTQEYPEEFSVSLNLLIVGPSVRMSNQYTFDLENHKISGFVQNAAIGRLMITTLARHVGDTRSVELLHQIGCSHPFARLRWSALESLAVLQPNQSREILEQATQDSHAYVRRQAIQKLEAE